MTPAPTTSDCICKIDRRFDSVRSIASYYDEATVECIWKLENEIQICNSPDSRCSCRIMTQSHKFVKRLYATQGPENNDQVYTDWAETYDKDMISVLRNKAKDELVKSVMNHIQNRDCTMLLDLAAGTGIAGQLFRKQGFRGIMDGLEPNVAMLKKAQEKEIYRKYICSTITADEELPVEKETYDVITITGGFGTNHIKQGSLARIIRALKVGGVTVFYTRNTGKIHEEYTLELDRVVHDLAKEGKLELVEERNVLHYPNTKIGEDEYAKLYVCKKL